MKALVIFSILLISGSVFSQETIDEGQQDLQTLNDNIYDCYKGRSGPNKPTEEECVSLAEQAAALVKVCDGRSRAFQDANYQLCDTAHNLYRVTLEQKLRESAPEGFKEKIKGIVSGAEAEAKSFLPSFMRGCDFSVGSVGPKTSREDRLRGVEAGPRGKGATCKIRF
jgi:hypothetical protein